MFYLYLINKVIEIDFQIISHNANSVSLQNKLIERPDIGLSLHFFEGSVRIFLII